MKPKIFISYSHKDKEWKDRLVEHLNVLVKADFFDLWVDSEEIEAGDLWREKIDEGLNTASIGIFLISRHFLTSDPIKEIEVAKLMERHKREGLRIIPVIVSPCAWNEVPWINVFHAFNGENGHELSRLSDPELDELLKRLAIKINDLLNPDSLRKKPKTSPFNVKRPGRRVRFGFPELVLLVILILFLGKMFLPKGPFDYSVRLRDARGKTVLKSKGNLRLAGKIISNEINEKGNAIFSQLPGAFAGTKKQVELEAPGWFFLNGSSSTTIKINRTGGKLTIRRNTLVFGTIIDEDGNGIEGAKIIVGDKVEFSGKDGKFRINPSPYNLTEIAPMQISKNGFDPKTINVSPGSPQESIIKLRKKKEIK